MKKSHYKTEYKSRLNKDTHKIQICGGAIHKCNYSLTEEKGNRYEKWRNITDEKDVRIFNKLSKSVNEN